MGGGKEVRTNCGWVETNLDVWVVLQSSITVNNNKTLSDVCIYLFIYLLGRHPVIQRAWHHTPPRAVINTRKP
jgi:hypothetical protein